MLDQMTMNKLYEMKLRSMAEAFRNQIQDQACSGLSFEERFGLIVDIEWAKRKNNRLARLIRNADLSENSACIENVEYAADRKLDKTQISSLATCNYIQEKHNIIILGAAGAGKFAGENAGLQRGDVIMEVNRRAVKSASEVAQALSSVPNGQDALVLVWSQGGSTFRVLHPSQG